MNRTARSWYKRYANSAKLDRILDHNEGPKSTGAKGYVCPGTVKSTGAIFPLPLWVRRLWMPSGFTSEFSLSARVHECQKTKNGLIRSLPESG